MTTSDAFNPPQGSSENVGTSAPQILSKTIGRDSRTTLAPVVVYHVSTCARTQGSSDNLGHTEHAIIIYIYRARTLSSSSFPAVHGNQNALRLHIGDVRCIFSPLLGYAAHVFPVPLPCVLPTGHLQPDLHCLAKCRKFLLSRHRKGFSGVLPEHHVVFCSRSGG